MEVEIPVRIHNKDGPILPLSAPCPDTRGLGVWPFVDKTLLVEDFLCGPKIALVLRPPRFGKSHILFMLRWFFSIQNDTKTLDNLFWTKWITSSPFFQKWAGTRPVIYVSFKVNFRIAFQ
jgi:hypothetical protein